MAQLDIQLGMVNVRKFPWAIAMYRQLDVTQLYEFLMLVGDFTPLHFGHLGSISATLDRLIEGLISWSGATDTFTTPTQFSIDQTFGLLYWSLIYLVNAFDHQRPEALID